MTSLVIGQTITEAKECARRGCTAAAMKGSAYCTDAVGQPPRERGVPMTALFHPKPVAPAPSAPVRIRREDGGVDLVSIVDSWTAFASGIAMLTVRHAPFGIRSFMVRADQVLADDEPDVRHDATECWPICETHRIEIAAARDNEVDL